MTRSKTQLLHVMEDLDEKDRLIRTLETRLGETLEELRQQARYLRRLEAENTKLKAEKEGTPHGTQAGDTRG